MGCPVFLTVGLISLALVFSKSEFRPRLSGTVTLIPHNVSLSVNVQRHSRLTALFSHDFAVKGGASVRTTQASSFSISLPNELTAAPSMLCSDLQMLNQAVYLSTLCFTI